MDRLDETVTEENFYPLGLGREFSGGHRRDRDSRWVVEQWTLEFNARITTSRSRSSCRQGWGKAIEKDGSIARSSWSKTWRTTCFVHDWRISTQKWLWETFTDAYWSGHEGHRKSTSSSVHAVNRCVVFATSRGQKSSQFEQRCKWTSRTSGRRVRWSIQIHSATSQISDRRRSPTWLLDVQLSDETDHVQTRKWKVEAHQWKTSMVSRDDFFEGTWSQTDWNNSQCVWHRNQTA